MDYHEEIRQEELEVDADLYRNEPHNRMILRMLIGALGKELATFLNGTDRETVGVLNSLLDGHSWQMGSGSPDNGLTLTLEIRGDLLNSTRIVSVESANGATARDAYGNLDPVDLDDLEA